MVCGWRDRLGSLAKEFFSSLLTEDISVLDMDVATTLLHYSVFLS